MATGIRKPGDFCWINILTSKPVDAMAFFGEVVGWTFFEMPGVGHGIRVVGQDIGGLFDLESPNTPPGNSPHIGVMVKVESADATADRVKSLGGSAKPAFDVFDAGRMAVCHDPNGAGFDVWEPRKLQGTAVDTTISGAPSWFESLTSDVGSATTFYHDLFGWTSTVNSMPGVDYTVFRNGGPDMAGMMAISPEMVGLKPVWGTYITVTEADKAAKVAGDLGGSLFVPPMDIPGIGRFAGIRSPQGVHFSVIHYLR